MSLQALVIAALLIALGSFSGGWMVKGWKVEADELGAVKLALESKVKAEAKRDELDKLADRQTRELAKLHKSKPAECRFTPDQLRVVGDAARGPVPAAAGAGK